MHSFQYSRWLASCLCPVGPNTPSFTTPNHPCQCTQRAHNSDLPFPLSIPRLTVLPGYCPMRRTAEEPQGRLPSGPCSNAQRTGQPLHVEHYTAAPASASCPPRGLCCAATAVPINGRFLIGRAQCESRARDSKNRARKCSKNLDSA
jgi:hypothetical protein